MTINIAISKILYKLLNSIYIFIGQNAKQVKMALISKKIQITLLCCKTVADDILIFYIIAF